MQMRKWIAVGLVFGAVRAVSGMAAPVDESLNVFLTDGVDQDWAEPAPVAPRAAAVLKAGDEERSIHQLQQEFYRQFDYRTEKQFDTLRAAPAPKAIREPAPRSGPLQKKVVGWHPYWMGTAYQRYDYSKLSTIAYFSYEVNPANGSYTTLRGWDTTPLIAWGTSNNVKVVLTATLFGNANVQQLLNNPTSRQNLIDTLVTVVSNRNGHGVNIDFEGITDNTLKAPLTQFMSNLTVRFHRDIPGSEVSIALPAVDWTAEKVFDVAAYDQFLDYAIIMGYDYHWKSGPTAGPVAPLQASGTFGAWCVERSINDYLARGIRPAKLLLGCPYYGYDWPTDSHAIPSPSRGTATAVLYPNAKANAATHGRQWSAAGSVPYYLYNNSGTRQTWYDDVQSLGLKYDMVNDKGIGGVGIWALGYDDPLPELWELLGEKFAGEPPATAWAAQASGTTADLYGAGARAGMAVVVGAGGAIRTSTDGATWQARTSGVADLLMNVDGSGPLWVVVGASGRILTSADGVTWTPRTTPTSQMLRGIAWGNGAYVAVGEAGTILRSTNGIAWTAPASGTSEVLQGVGFGGGQFVAVGASGVILTSPNGSTWTARTSGTTQWLFDVAHGGGTYVAVGANGTIRTSPDGITWTARTSGVAGHINRVAYGNSRFAAIGASGAVLGSANGVSWMPETAATTSNLRGLAFADGLFRACGFGGTILVNGLGMPSVSITTASGSVPAAMSNRNVSGTASVFTTGHLRWANSLGGSGSVAAAASWTINIPLAVGDNVITVTVSNAAGQTASASVTFTRPAAAPPPGTPVAAAQPSGALSDIIVYTSAGHGLVGDTGSWRFGRGLTHGMVEDVGNIDQLNYFVDYCFKAGATVVPMRPVGQQTNEVVLDNVSASVTWGGAWHDSTSTIYYGAAGAVPYRYAYINPTGTTAWAIYRPTIPEAGFYPVYAWARSGSDRVKQLYRVYHSGGVTDVRVNHRRVGLGWVWLGTYYFEAGTAGSVNISNHAPGENPGSNVVIADAIRFGNGMGSINRGSGVSGFPRELEASRYWIQAMVGQGMSAGLYDLSGYNDNSDNVGAPVRMAAEMNREADGSFWDRIYLGFHSNADGGAGTARGPMGLWDNRGATEKINRQKDFGTLIANELHHDLNYGQNGTWFPDGYANNSANLYGSAYGELYGSVNAEMNSTIIETAFHNNAADANLLKCPSARRVMAMSSYQAIVKHLSTNNPAVPLALLPDPPTHVSAANSGPGSVTIRWRAPVVNAAGGHAATGYVVYRSSNGYGFGNPVTVSGGGTLSTTLTGLEAGQTLYFQVCAVNSGGESLPSKTVGVRVSPSGQASYLVVNGYERNDRSLTPSQYIANGINGNVARVIQRKINSQDYVVQHGSALAAAGSYFDSCDQDAVQAGQVSLMDYHAAFWILGRESTAGRTFNAAEQSLVSAFLDAGRNLFVSGSEIAYDLDATGSAADKLFLTNRLRVAYAADSAGTYQATAKNGSIFQGLGSFLFDNGSGPTYNVNSADVFHLRGNPSSSAALVYGGAEGGTAIAAAQFSGAWRAVVMGIPFETILSEGTRHALMTRVVNYFGAPPQDAPVIQITTPATNLPAGTTSFTLHGTHNDAVTGNLTWSNRLSGASGTRPAGSPWSIAVPVVTGTNVVAVIGRNHAQTQSATATVSIVVAVATSAPPAGILHADFESGTLDGWTSDSPGTWIASPNAPVSGTYSLRHSSTGSTNNYIYTQPSYSVANGLTTWRFILKFGSYDPSGLNRFHVFLMSDQPNLIGSVNGYAVGVNMGGSSSDLLRLCRVSNGAIASTVVVSDLDWDPNMTVAVEVTRTPSGIWSLAYSASGAFDSLVTTAKTGLDATFTNSSYFGLVYICTSGRQGILWLDDVSITQVPYPEVILPASPISLPNTTTSWTLTGSAIHAVGNLVWTNLAGGSGMVPAASNWTLTVTGLKTGDNVIQVVSTGAAGIRSTGSVTIVRSPYAAANAGHDPAAVVPGGGPMRAPAEPLPSGDVALFSASQSAGAGNAATQTGGAVRYRRSGTATWLSAPMEFHSTVGDTTYWRGRLPAGAFPALTSIEYYLELTYSDRETTYVALNASGQPSAAGTSRTIAQSRPFSFTYGDDAGHILNEDFEPGTLTGWFSNDPEAWVNSAVAPISGFYSLKHNLDWLNATSTLYALPDYSLDSARTVWRFVLKNGNWDPSGNNRFHVFLMADSTDLLGSVNGYAVGVNMGGSISDILRLCRVDNGSIASHIVVTSLDWDENMTVAVEVTRHPNGQWELRYSPTNRFDNLIFGGAGTDTTHQRTDVFGLVFQCTPMRAGLLWWDDIRISQEVISSLAIEEDIYRVANADTQGVIGGTASHVTGSLTWTNSRGGSGSGPASTNWSLTVTGLQVGENRIQVTASNAAGGRVTAETTIIRSAWSLGNASHTPGAMIAGVDTMRSPVAPLAGQPVYLYSASQAAGSGNVAQQTGGRLFYRQGASGWSSVNLAYDSFVDPNAIWRGRIPPGAYSPGQAIQYVFELTYADRETTYLSAGGVGGSLAAAQSTPFTFTYSASTVAAVFHDDFESGSLAAWSPNDAAAWEITDLQPINGVRSLRHNRSRVVSTDAIAASVPVNAAADRTTWRFVLRNGDWDPSINNKFFVYLLADRADLLGPVNGYAVGVNLTGFDDILKIWRVVDGSASAVVAASDLDWDENMTVAVEVIRQANGQWELRYALDGGFQALSPPAFGTDTMFTAGSHFGLTFICTMSRAGMLRMDDVWISRATTPGPMALRADEDPAASGAPARTAPVLGLAGVGDASGVRWLVWPSEVGRLYAIDRSTNLLEGFTPWITGIPATPPENTYLVPLDAETLYLRIREEE